MNNKNQIFSIIGITVIAAVIIFALFLAYKPSQELRETPLPMQPQGSSTSE